MVAGEADVCPYAANGDSESAIAIAAYAQSFLFCLFITIASLTEHSAVVWLMGRDLN